MKKKPPKNCGILSSSTVALFISDPEPEKIYLKKTVPTCCEISQHQNQPLHAMYPPRKLT